MSKNSRYAYVVVVGARPNFVKVAPLFHYAQQQKNIDLTLIHTGQHFDQNLSSSFFRELGIPTPDILIRKSTSTATLSTGNLVEELYQVLKDVSPSTVIVVGDVNSTLAAALASKKAGKFLVHLEAGLRCGDDNMPEEKNRIVVDHLSDLLLYTEESAIKNLLREGVNKDKLLFVGNIMIESLIRFLPQADSCAILNKYQLVKENYIITTLHRRENISQPNILKKYLLLLQDLSLEYKIIFPIHPHTRLMIERHGFMELLQNITISKPESYLNFMKLLSLSAGVITDSGGVQEEATFLKIPCATLREHTERPITISAGTNKLFSWDTVTVKNIKNHFSKKSLFNKNYVDIPGWDKDVTQRIFHSLKIHAPDG